MSSSVEEVLRALGCPAISSGSDPAGYAVLYRVARALVQSARTVVGFVPAEDDIGVPALLLQIAGTLLDIDVPSVRVVDANTRYPALGAALPAPTPEAGSSARLQIVHPTQAPTPIVDLPAVERALERARRADGLTLVDLTGFERDGVLLRAYQLVDAAYIVVQRHSTKDLRFRDLLAQVPKPLHVGVLYSG